MRRPSLTRVLLGMAGGLTALAVPLAEAPEPARADQLASAWRDDDAGRLLARVEPDRPGVNDAPELRILSPLPMTQLPADAPASLVATAADPEEGELSGEIRWSSSRDGFLGSGGNVERSLSRGLHTLSAEVRDAGGTAMSASVDIQVTASGHVLLAAGDIASCNSNGDEATSALLDERYGHVVTLGDNAYPDGTHEQFRRCYAPSWGRHKARTHPAAGNHDYRTEGAAAHFAYFGAAAGDPARGWYGFDLGRWRVVVLNSNCQHVGGCSPSSPQGRWLQAELAAHPGSCTLAVMHHPRFSSGSKHGSGTTKMRRLIRTVVEHLRPEPGFSLLRADGRDDPARAALAGHRGHPLQSGVAALYDVFHSQGGDVVLSGHDHNYERFAPQDAFGMADPLGPRQFVVGTGGAKLRPMGVIQPNSVAYAAHAHGLLELTLHEASYEWSFLPAAGASYSDSGNAACVAAPQRPVGPTLRQAFGPSDSGRR